MARERHQRNHRSNSGQAILGGTAMLILISILGGGMLMLLFYLAVMSNDYQQLTSIANEAARQVANSRFTYGMERPEFKETEAEAAALQAINNELEVLGYKIKGTPDFTYKYTTIARNGVGNDIPAMIVEVGFDVSATNPGSFAKVLFTPPHVSGQSSDNENAIRRHAMALILFVDPKNPAIQRGIRVPIYNYTRLASVAARPNMMRAGRSVGAFPTALLRIVVPHNGFFQRDKSRRVGNDP
jgi:hypothetical protein